MLSSQVLLTTDAPANVPFTDIREHILDEQPTPSSVTVRVVPLSRVTFAVSDERCWRSSPTRGAGLVLAPPTAPNTVTIAANAIHRDIMLITIPPSAL